MGGDEEAEDELGSEAKVAGLVSLLMAFLLCDEK